MAITNKEQQDADQAVFAEQFNAGDQPPAPRTADVAGAAAPDNAAKAAEYEKHLADWEAALTARQAQLDAQQAAMRTSNTNERQTSTVVRAGAASTPEENDPGQALADDFGPEFVQLLTQLIRKVCGNITEGIGALESTVQSVIDHLNTEGQKAHFQAIKSVHDDVMEIIDSDPFQAWRAAQPAAEQRKLAAVIDAGSAQEIIDMLTRFKTSKQAQDGIDDAALAAAEGVRSSGRKLPARPAAADDYASAWAAA